MPIWFTVEEERPDIGTVIFKADDYYERLQHITGMWNQNKFLYSETAQRPRIHPSKSVIVERDPNQIFGVADINNVPSLLAYLERANLKGVLPANMMDFMWDLHKLYVKKMCEFGYATHVMSKKEYDLLENNEKWTRLVKAMDELRLNNVREEILAKKRKRKLMPVLLKTFTRLEQLYLNKKDELARKGSNPRASVDVKKVSADDAAIFRLDKNHQIFLKEKKGSKVKKFFIKQEYENPYAWDFGGTRLFDRKYTRKYGHHIEFSRFYRKIKRALRFSKSEPIDWRTICLGEVDKHRYPNDCWMVIKGRVYDITKYLKKHPGGAHLVMQGAGIDATDIFVSVHPYVVFYKHLTRMQVGTVPDFQEHYHTEWEPPAYFDIFRILKEWYSRPKNPLAKYKPSTSFKQTETHFVYTVSFPSSLKSAESDWTVAIVSGFKVTIIKCIDPPFVWYGGFDLRTEVMDDTAYRSFSSDYNRLELKIAKSYKVNVKRPVKDWRQDHGYFLNSYSLKDMFRASVVERTRIADGVKLYGLSVGLNKYIGCPIGCYVNLKILDEIRPYTPICLPDEFEKKFKDDSGEFQTLFFIIKEFKDGDFTPMLHYLPVKRILKGVELYISPPMGNFQPSFLFNNMNVMMLIAGGTGISVMTRIIQEYIHQKEKMVGSSVCLLFFVQDREDLIWKDVWTALDAKHDWFHFYYSLTHIYRIEVDRNKEDRGDQARASGGIDWEDRRPRREMPRVLEADPVHPEEMYGYPAVTKLQYVYDRLPGAIDEKYHKAIVCGPFGFNHSCEKMLEGFGMHTDDDIHYFAG